MSAWIPSIHGTRARASASIAAAPSTPVTRSPRARNQAAIGSPEPQPRSSTDSPAARPATVASSAGASQSSRFRSRAHRAASRS
jgi:hypothetical protein